nr:AEC family transporter [bacterium]
IVLLGAFLTHKKWMNPSVADFLSRIVTRVALPCLVVTNLNQYFDRQGLFAAGKLIIMPLLSMLITIAIGWGLVYACRIPKGRRGIFVALITFSNTVFVGLPVCTALFGESASGLALCYYLANTLLFWSLGVWMIARDNPQASNAPSAQWKRLISPPMIAVLLTSLQIGLGIPLPGFLLKATRYVGNLCTPLALMFIGYTLYGSFRRGLRWTRGMTAVLVGRLLLAPMLVFGLGYVMGTDSLAVDVFVIQAAMPSMSQMPLIARSYGADEEFAATCTALSTLISLLVLPLVRLLQMV